MRGSKVVTVILFGMYVLIVSQCRKNNAEPELPPETTNGAGTFGCKVIARNFVPKSGNGQPGLYVKYSRTGVGLNESWNLVITAVNYGSKHTELVQIGTDSLLLETGKKYIFDKKSGFPFIVYAFDLKPFPYKPEKSGELYITKHDKDARILSGRFWFNIYSLADSSIVRVTEGRFDVRY